nr:LysR substrate-binding domain-containing protein [Microvirga zambiensis]
MSGRVRVDVHSSMANMLLIPALDRFRTRYPNIQLVIGITDKPVVLIEEAVDCIVNSGDLQIPR